MFRISRTKLSDFEILLKKKKKKKYRYGCHVTFTLHKKGRNDLVVSNTEALT